MNILKYYRTIIGKCLEENGWTYCNTKESGSSYYTLFDDNSIKFRLSDHVYCAYHDSTFQLIMSDIQPGMFHIILRGSTYVVTSIKDVKQIINTITMLYKCSMKYFMSKNTEPIDNDGKYWKKRYENISYQLANLNKKIEFDKQKQKEYDDLKKQANKYKAAAGSYKGTIKKYENDIVKLKKRIEELENNK
ncbi:MAG: hypothetical protein J6D03_00115 [Clostridia bacterium]|nr:hypothetical protein [Clostridia bacterium]